MLSSEIENLIKEAEDSKRHAIAPYSGFVVGAALITDRGKLYTGCNIENPSLMMSFCAERAALLKALTEGERAFKAIAIVSGEREYCFPCGTCRQMLYEFAPDLAIYLSSGGGTRRYSLSELLPHAFRKE